MFVGCCTYPIKSCSYFPFNFYTIFFIESHKRCKQRHCCVDWNTMSVMLWRTSRTKKMALESRWNDESRTHTHNHTHTTNRKRVAHAAFDQWIMNSFFWHVGFTVSQTNKLIWAMKCLRSLVLFFLPPPPHLYSRTPSQSKYPLAVVVSTVQTLVHTYIHHLHMYIHISSRISVGNLILQNN